MTLFGGVQRWRFIRFPKVVWGRVDFDIAGWRRGSRTPCGSPQFEPFYGPRKAIQWPQDMLTRAFICVYVYIYIDIYSYLYTSVHTCTHTCVRACGMYMYAYIWAEHTALAVAPWLNNARNINTKATQTAMNQDNNETRKLKSKRNHQTTTNKNISFFGYGL